MSIVKVGDTRNVACNHCESFQNVTFVLNDVSFSSDSDVVKSILVGVCDVCDTIAVISHQSSKSIQLEIQSRSFSTTEISI